VKPTPEPSTSRATHSRPANHDVADSHIEPSLGEPTLIGDSGETVGFLDAPGLGPDQLRTAIAEALQSLAAGSVLTVYNDHPSSDATVADLCQGEGLALVNTIRHSAGGTTFALRKQT
jgi:TusA-related sulfurtransferase